MSFNDEYLKLRKKRLQEQEKQTDGMLYKNKTAALKSPAEMEDIAPVKTEEKDERKWFQKGAFEDGYQFGDLTRTIFGSSKDLESSVMAGVLGIGEKVVDAGAYAVGAVGGLFSKDFKENTKEFIAKDLYDERAIAEKLVEVRQPFYWFNKNENESSVFGDKVDSLAESGGQLLGTMALQSVGVPWFVTSGVTSFGGETENAFNQGATYGEAGLSAAVTAGAEMLTEKLFGGSGLGEKGLIDTSIITKGISNKVVKLLADYGVDIAAEGSEEVISQIFSNLGTALYREENLGEIMASEEAFEEYFESFIGGMALGGVANVGKVVNHAKTGTDYRTELTKNEQAVFDLVYNERLAEESEGGKKLTDKEKRKIYDEVKQDLAKGRIDTDTIEAVLGGDTYMEYKNTTSDLDAKQKEFDELGGLKESDFTVKQRDRYNELKQLLADAETNKTRDNLKSQLSKMVQDQLIHTDNKGNAKFGDNGLIESYLEKDRRGQKYEADLTQYDAKQQETVKKAMESGVLNNTNRTHELVDLIAKVSADKGVPFDFTNNEKLKESGFAVDGKFVNGYFDKASGTIGVNVQSKKYLNTVVGHEITHVLEGTELYTELQKAVFAYAKTKKDYAGRRKYLEGLYKAEDIDSELTADLVGDYLFDDADFIMNLSTKNRNVFQKIYDEIKYLCKVVTAGSKEARELEKVKRAFEKAYRESATQAKAETEVKHSLGYHAGDLGKAEGYHMQGGGRDTGHFGTGTYFVGDEAKINDSYYGKRPHHSVEFDNYNLYKVSTDKDGYKLHENLRALDRGVSQEFLDAAIADKFNVSEMRTEAFRLTEKYDTKEMDADLGFEVSTDYIGASIRAMAEVAESNGVEFQSYDEWLAEQGDDVPTQGDSDYEYYKRDYHDYLRDVIESADEARNKGYGKFRDSYFDLWLKFGKNKVNHALQEVVNHQAKMKDGGDAVQYGADSNATVFMKALGYEGIDVRGTGLDNVGYGSVIYDLKGDDLARKNEIGTAKYSLSDDGKGKKSLDKYNQKQYNDFGWARDTEAVTKNELDDMYSKIHEKGSLKKFPQTSNGEAIIEVNDSPHTTLGTDNVFVFVTGTNNNPKINKVVRFQAETDTEMEIIKEKLYERGSFSDTYYSFLRQEGFAREYSKKSALDYNGYAQKVRGRSGGADSNQTDRNSGIQRNRRWTFEEDQSNEIAPIKETSSTDGVFFDGKNTRNADIRFSLSKSVEETKDLIAMHNVSEDKLKEALRLGGLPSPSVAITKKDIAHDNYGGITLLLQKDAIDPQADSRNKVYGSDAWTPTISNARTEYEVNSDKARAFEKKLAELSKKTAGGAFSRESLVRSLGVDDVSDQNATQLAERLARHDEVRAAYLAEMGQTIEPEYKAKVYNKFGNKALQTFIDKVGVQHLATLVAESKLGNMDGIRAEDETVRKIIRDTYAEEHAYSLNRRPDLKEKRIDAYMEKHVYAITIEDFVLDAWEFYQDGGAVTEEIDRLATSDKLRQAVNDSDVRAWLEPQIAEFLGEPGIYNGKDMFFSDGRRRSFAETHYTYTAENIVKAMQNAPARGSGTFGAHATSLIATATPSYNSIEEMHADKGRLKVEDQETYNAILHDIDNALNDVEHDIMRTTKHYADNTFDEEQIIGSIITEAATGTRTVSAVKRAFAKEGYTITTEQAQKVLALYNKAANVPTGYFEAKPERVVGFNEVAAFIIPNNADVKLKQELLNAGYNIAEYDPNVEGDRKRVVNQFEDYTFSLSDANNAPQKRYGGLNITGDDVRFEAPMQEDIAPMAEDVANNATTTPTVSKMEQVEDYAPISEDEANALQGENIASLTDADAPPEMEAPYYGESEDAEPADPFENRDIKAVGKRNVKAYMYENPEVKPFFQAEANILLGELQDTQKGERFYTPVEGGVPGQYGVESLGVWTGVSRHTTQDIEYLLDTCKMSYADIEKGCKAIIEDNGAENIAAAKKIEFVLNSRLMDGYTTIDGYPIPGNQDYINLLNEKQIQEYSDEARKSFFDDAAAYAPQEDIAPIAEDFAPVKEQYEAIKPKRENSAEPRLKRVDSKSKAPGGMEERSWYETSTGSEAVDNMITPDDIPDDVRYYQVKSNKKTLEAANRRLAKDGYAKSREYFEGRMSERKLSVEDIALGERLIQEAAKAGDAKAVRDLIIDVSIIGTELGQRVQALSLIRRLTPEGQLKALQRTVDRGKAKGDKAYDGVEVTEDMTKQILDTYKEDGTFDQMDLDRAIEDAKQKLADQMPVTTGEKLNAWRYLSMLGNPKTHIRNVVSNVAMFGTRAVKNAIARTIEGIAPIKSRTKTWKQSSDAVKAFAKQTTMEMESAIKGDTKYSEEASIKAKRQIFERKRLNAVHQFNQNALEKEDFWFSRPAFESSLREYLTANGIVTETDILNNPEIVSNAREYALEEARKATFRQDSYMANKIAEIEKKNAAFGVAIGSVMPFKKTPINVAKTGLAYSPLGFARNIYDAVQVKKGNMDASEAVDHLAQTLTGTSLTLIGFALASAGILNGAGDDDKEGKYDYQLGKQSYSFNFGGDTFSLSWLSPVAMPLFVGANAYEKLVQQNEWDANVVIDTLAQTLDPLSEMSFLSSLDDVLSSYDSGVEKIWGAGESMVQNYVTQFIPTLSSQVAATFDDTKRSTKASRDSGFKFGEETLKKVMYKVPGLRNTLEPTTDIWGNEAKQTENFFARGFESFLSPANKRAGIATEVDDEIKDLYRQTGKSEVIPSIPYDYINYDGVKYEMSASEHTAYKQTYGQTAYDLLEQLFDTNSYKNATSEERASMVRRVYDYASDAAKLEYLAGRDVDFTNAKEDGEDVYREDAIKGAIEADLPVDEYQFSIDYPEKYKFFNDYGISYQTYKNADEDGKRAYTWAAENPGKYTMSKAVSDDFLTFYQYRGEIYDLKADKDADGKSISGSRKEKVIDYVNSLDIDYGARLILFKSEYKADDSYNMDIVNYLNSREDISYQEMETILKELGFKVYADGTITWD